jgi:hypothetical protein
VLATVLFVYKGHAGACLLQDVEVLCCVRPCIAAAADYNICILLFWQLLLLLQGWGL